MTDTYHTALELRAIKLLAAFEASYVLDEKGERVPIRMSGNVTLAKSELESRIRDEARRRLREAGVSA